MASMLANLFGAALLVAASQAKTETPAPDRVALVASGDAEYTALAIPRSYKSAPDARTHLLVFRGGLCIRDIGLADVQNREEHGTPSMAVMEETGTTERAFVAPDGRVAVIVRTRYVSRVDVTPGNKSTAGDTVTGDTTLTLIDPEHVDGRWHVTLENSRWAKDVLALAAARGVVVTTFVPRTGPTDVRILDPMGHESLRVPESSGETLKIDASPDGGYVGAEVSFPDRASMPERGVMVFDLAHGTQWTYGWRYGAEAEPSTWALRSGGVLAVALPGGTRRFDAQGRKL
jgi:hypothetical protein